MVKKTFTLPKDYWDKFELLEDDTELLYNHLLELETPLTAAELLTFLVEARIKRELENLEQQQRAGGEIYLPKKQFQKGQLVVFPQDDWRSGKVVKVRPGNNLDIDAFKVIQVDFGKGEKREFAAGLDIHELNEQPQTMINDIPNPEDIIEEHQGVMLERVQKGLETNPDFIYIAGRWFPRALLIDINDGHLNLAEAVLDMNDGGPLPTAAILEQVGVEAAVSPKLLEFSMDRALQEDPRFDEVGPAGEVQWFLQRLEPKEVLHTPQFLRHKPEHYDRAVLTKEMLALELELDDEYSPVSPDLHGDSPKKHLDKAEIHLIFPHWRAGTLPLSAKVKPIFPTAYEAPHVRFWLVDGDTKEKFSAWVIRNEGYVYGLSQWYESRGLIPGSVVRIQRSQNPGEVVLQTGGQRSSRDWMRTVLVGTDGGIVFAMLRQIVKAEYDERMAVVIPKPQDLDPIWERMHKERWTLERIVLTMLHELAKLAPQGHVHASELYSAVNLVHRCPPGPIMALLASNPQFTHVGDLYFHLVE